MQDTKKTRPSKHSRNNTHRNSQRLWQNGQGLVGSGPNEVLALNPIPKPETIFNRLPLTKEKLIFSNRVSQGIQTSLKSRSHPQQ